MMVATKPQGSGYAGRRKLAEGGDVRLAFCSSHVRRNFYDLLNQLRALFAAPPAFAQVAKTL